MLIFNFDRKEQFLPWHRWYLLQMENLFRRIDCRVTVPYWDWSLFSGTPWRSTVNSIYVNSHNLRNFSAKIRERCRYLSVLKIIVNGRTLLLTPCRKHFLNKNIMPFSNTVFASSVFRGRLHKYSCRHFVRVKIIANTKTMTTKRIRVDNYFRKFLTEIYCRLKLSFMHGFCWKGVKKTYFEVKTDN